MHRLKSILTLVQSKYGQPISRAPKAIDVPARTRKPMLPTAPGRLFSGSESLEQ